MDNEMDVNQAIAICQEFTDRYHQDLKSLAILIASQTPRNHTRDGYNILGRKITLSHGGREVHDPFLLTDALLLLFRQGRMDPESYKILPEPFQDAHAVIDKGQQARLEGSKEFHREVSDFSEEDQRAIQALSHLPRVEISEGPKQALIKWRGENTTKKRVTVKIDFDGRTYNLPRIIQSLRNQDYLLSDDALNFLVGLGIIIIPGTGNVPDPRENIDTLLEAIRHVDPAEINSVFHWSNKGIDLDIGKTITAVRVGTTYISPSDRLQLEQAGLRTYIVRPYMWEDTKNVPIETILDVLQDWRAEGNTGPIDVNDVITDGEGNIFRVGHRIFEIRTGVDVVSPENAQRFKQLGVDVSCVNTFPTVGLSETNENALANFSALS